MLKVSVFALVVFFVLIYVIHPVESGKCPRNWTKFDGHCYKTFICKTCQYAEYNEKCAKKGGYLVRITTSRENTFVSRLVKGKGKNLRLNAFIGGTRANKRSPWTFSDNTPMKYKFFGNGPSPLPGNCIYMDLETTKWTDIDCKSFGSQGSGRYVCEREP